MQSDTVNRLLELNREFYQTFAPQFSATRQRLQPGVQAILASLPSPAHVLDLGCGNGELARVLVQRGLPGDYLGLDFSPALLEVARQGLAEAPGFDFWPADLADPGWAQQPPILRGAPYTTILAFAVLHHLPSHSLRLAVLRAVSGLLASDGHFIHSNWQFLNSSRLRARIIPWQEAGLAVEQLEPGDYLLDWRAGGRGLRYVHHFTSQELHDLAAESGFQVSGEFLSDGEGGNLGLYQTWKRSPTPAHASYSSSSSSAPK